MNLRIPEELDALLDDIAEAEHTSKSALLLLGAQLIVERDARRRSVIASLKFVTTHDGDLLKRLEDA